MATMGVEYADKHGVMMIGDPKDVMQVGIVAEVSVFPDEKALLSEFILWMRSQDPDILFHFPNLIFLRLSLIITRYFGGI